MRLVIPSRERAKWLMNRKHSTLKAIHFLNPVLYVRYNDSELEDYKRYAEIYKIELLIYKLDNLGISEVYDLIIEDSIKLNEEKLIILDDDISLKIHNPILGNKPNFKQCNNYEIEEFLKHLAYLTSPELPLGSFIPLYTRTQPRIINFAHLITIIYSFHLSHFKKYPEFRFYKGIKFEAYCDHVLTLQVLNAGFLTACLASCLIHHELNNPGGCLTYRTKELNDLTCITLSKLYPEHITLRIRKGWLRNPDIKRNTIMIQWKKIFDKEKFQERFKISANNFIQSKLKEYEIIYSNFIRSIRSK